MKTQEHITSDYKKYQPWFSAAVILVLTLILFGIFKFYEEENEYHVIKFRSTGKADVLNLSRIYYMTYTERDSSGTGAILANKGDLILFNSFMKYYEGPQKDSFSFRDEDDSLLYFDNHINTINISAEYDLIPLFERLTASEISGMETIMFTGNIPDEYIPYLRKIAEIKPQINLSFNTDDSESSFRSYIAKADFFSPRNVAVDLRQDEFPLLEKWQSIECLYMTIEDSIVTDPLPAMPSLNQFIIVEDDNQVLNPMFLKNNPQLKKLTLFNDQNPLSILQPLDKVEELAILNNNRLDISKLSRFSDKINALLISGKCDHIDALSNFKKLRWLGLPENTSQLQFDKIVNAIPHLEILDLTGSGLITSYRSLLPLSRLMGLVITDSVTDKETLMQLNQLAYLSVSGKGNDSELIANLQKALPGCIVVPNSGACLGSGWLILIIPLVLLFAAIISYCAKKKITER